MYRKLFSCALLWAITLSIGSRAMDIASPDHESIRSLYNELLPPDAEKVGEYEGSQLAEALIAFSEEEQRDVAIVSVVDMLQRFKTRLKQVHTLTVRYPCLKNDLAIAALLGFKPQSAIQCRDIDYDALQNDINAIEGLKSFYEYDQRLDAHDNYLDKIKYAATVFFSAKYFLYDFTITNVNVLKKLRSDDQQDNRILSGRCYGYDRMNSSLFCTAEGIGKVQTKENFFGGEMVFWLAYKGGEKAAEIKLQGYEILLKLAHMNWDYLDKNM